MSFNGDQPHYEKYLSDLHSKMVVSDEIIRDATKEASGSYYVSKQRIIAGEANEVYDLELANGERVIMRISRKEKPDFEQEKWAAEQCKKLEIPVADFLLIKHMKFEGKPLSICVQNKLEGDTLERGKINFRKADPEYFKRMIIRSGEILSKIHSIKTDGFGYIDGKGKGEFGPYKKYLREYVNQKDEFWLLAEKINLDKNLLTKIFAVIEDFIEKAEDKSPVLDHNDYGPKHFLVKGERITGILDFGEAAGNSAVGDFASWDYWYDEAPTEWLMEGYQNKALFDENFQKEMSFIKLNHGLGVLWWYSKQGYPKRVEEIKSQLLKDFNSYRLLQS